MTAKEAYQAFKAADERWSNDLRLAFGKQAGDKRYTDDGQVHPFCVSSYAEFERTGKQWRACVAKEKEPSIERRELRNQRIYITLTEETHP